MHSRRHGKAADVEHRAVRLADFDGQIAGEGHPRVAVPGLHRRRLLRECVQQAAGDDGKVRVALVDEACRQRLELIELAEQRRLRRVWVLGVENRLDEVFEMVLVAGRRFRPPIGEAIRGELRDERPAFYVDVEKAVFVGGDVPDPDAFRHHLEQVLERDVGAVADLLLRMRHLVERLQEGGKRFAGLEVGGQFEGLDRRADVLHLLVQEPRRLVQPLHALHHVEDRAGQLHVHLLDQLERRRHHAPGVGHVAAVEQALQVPHELVAAGVQALLAVRRQQLLVVADEVLGVARRNPRETPLEVLAVCLGQAGGVAVVDHREGGGVAHEVAGVHVAVEEAVAEDGLVRPLLHEADQPLLAGVHLVIGGDQVSPRAEHLGHVAALVGDGAVLVPHPLEGGDDAGDLRLALRDKPVVGDAGRLAQDERVGGGVDGGVQLHAPHARHGILHHAGGVDRPLLDVVGLHREVELLEDALEADVEHALHAGGPLGDFEEEVALACGAALRVRAEQLDHALVAERVVGGHDLAEERLPDGGGAERPGELDALDAPVGAQHHVEQGGAHHFRGDGRQVALEVGHGLAEIVRQRGLRQALHELLQHGARALDHRAQDFAEAGLVAGEAQQRGRHAVPVDRLHLGEVCGERLHQQLAVAGVDVERTGARDFVERLLPELLALHGGGGPAERGGELLGEHALHPGEHLVGGGGEVAGEALEEILDPGVVAGFQLPVERVDAAGLGDQGLELVHAGREGGGQLVDAGRAAVLRLAGREAERLKDVGGRVQRAQHHAQLVLVGEERRAHDVRVGPARGAVEVVARGVVRHHQLGHELVHPAHARLGERLPFAHRALLRQLDHAVDVRGGGFLHLLVELQGGRAVEARHAVAPELRKLAREVVLRGARLVQHAARDRHHVAGGDRAELRREGAGEAEDDVESQLARAAALLRGVLPDGRQKRARLLPSVRPHVEGDLVFDLVDERRDVERTREDHVHGLLDLDDVAALQGPRLDAPSLPLGGQHAGVGLDEVELDSAVGDGGLRGPGGGGHLLQRVEDFQRLVHVGGRRRGRAHEEQRGGLLLRREAGHRVEVVDLDAAADIPGDDVPDPAHFAPLLGVGLADGLAKQAEAERVQPVRVHLVDVEQERQLMHQIPGVVAMLRVIRVDALRRQSAAPQKLVGLADVVGVEAAQVLAGWGRQRSSIADEVAQDGDRGVADVPVEGQRTLQQRVSDLLQALAAVLEDG